MNKLGFYIEITTVQYLRDALEKVRPPVILVHASDRGLMREIRERYAPNAFIIGRMFFDTAQQDAMLNSAAPEGAGQALAEKIINYDYEYAFEKVNGKLVIDAWMSLNEAVRGPASFPNDNVDDEFRRRADAYDRLQVAFLERLRSRGLEGVAFNFAAGNYRTAKHYTDWYGRSLQAFKYLGFHEYGWPALQPGPDVASAALDYRTVMAGVRQKYPNAAHKVIITEAGLTWAYKDPTKDDVGWLNRTAAISEDNYWKSLLWYNTEMVKDDYVLGACLYEVGHNGGRWESFRHLGVDNNSRPILLMDKIRDIDTVVIPDDDDDDDDDDDSDNDGDQPPDNRSAAELLAALAKIKADLAVAATMPADLAGQVADLNQRLAAISARLTGAAGWPAQVEGLRKRVSGVEAALGKAAVIAKLGPERVTAIRAECAGMRVSLERLAKQAQTAADTVAQAGQLRPPSDPEVNAAVMLAQTARALTASAAALEAEIKALGGETPRPVLRDVRTTLPQHPSERYPTRPLSAIRRIIVHHTVTSPSASPTALAQSHVNRGLAGIAYHYVVSGDGAIYWTQPLEALTGHSLQAAANADGVAVALVGTFTDVVPSDVQLRAAAGLIAWLLGELHLAPDVIVGRSEIDTTVGSPGRQWLDGAKYKTTLLAAVQQVFPGPQ